MTICDINLIARRRSQKQRMLALLRLGTYSLIALFVVVISLCAWMTVATRLAKGEIAEVEAKLSDPELVASMERINFLESNIAQLGPRVHLLEKVHGSEQAWIEILNDLGFCIPDGVWVGQMVSRRTEKKQEISIRGSAFDQKRIGDFMLNLDQPQWSEPAQLGFSQANVNQQKTRIIDFEITVPLTQIIGSNLK